MTKKKRIYGASTRDRYTPAQMIDLFSLGLTHGLMMLAAWRLLFRAELDVEADRDA